MADGKHPGDPPDNGESTIAADGDPPAAPVQLADPAAQLEVLAAERDRLAAENAALQDQILRRQADYENFRRRAERERIEMSEYASMQATQSLLPVLDDFERALKSLPAGDSGAAEYAKGIELIYGRLLDTLAKLGLEPVEAAGRPFDPNLHNAIQREERADFDDQTVLEDFQRGYTFKGRLLRPAMVKVAVKP